MACPLARRDAGPQTVIGWAGCALEGQSTRTPQKAPLARPTCLHWLCFADCPSAFKDGGCPVPTSLSLRKAALLKAPVGTAQLVDTRSPAVPGGTPRCKPTSSTDISTNISTDTHEKRPFGGCYDGSASADGPAARSSPWPRMPAEAGSYQSARGPAELREDVPHHIPCPAALGAGAEQLPDELQNCPPHLPGESVVMTLLFKTQRVCLGAAFVVHGEMMRAWQKLLVLVSGLGFSTRLDGHLPHRAQ